MLMNSKLTEKQQTKWLVVIKNELMSSEESDEDDAILVHPFHGVQSVLIGCFKRLMNTVSLRNHHK